MAKKFEKIEDRVRKFIESQVIFFVATARSEGSINLSPKGMDTFRIISPTKICWLNLTGSGNETAAHLSDNPRMTIMFCSFEEKPLILRLYGKAKLLFPSDEEYDKLLEMFPSSLGHRQIIEMDIDLVQTSCGFGIPLMEYKGERGMLDKWASEKGEDGLEAYRKEKNTLSLDGHQIKV